MTLEEKLTYLVLRGWCPIPAIDSYPIHRVIHPDYSGWYYVDSALFIEEHGLDEWRIAHFAPTHK